MRWCELAAFTTMYRSHLGTLPNENWQFNSDNETLQHFFKMAVVFKGLSAYRSVLMEETYHYGWPVIRHMMLNYPNNSKVYAEDLTRQFMLGDQFIVAPVLEKGATSVRVFLPMGTTWRHIWTAHDLKGTYSSYYCKTFLRQTIYCVTITTYLARDIHHTHKLERCKYICIVTIMLLIDG